jgi:ABC-type polysaccharide/polyol phosphate transport system ATPase subunit
MVDLCDRIVLMEDGKVVDVGHPSEMYKLYKEILKQQSPE